MDAELPLNPDCPNCLKMKTWIEENFRILETRIRDLEDELKKYKGVDKSPRVQEPIPPPAKKMPTGKKAGGQKGHSPHIRKWLPKERVTKMVAFIPEHCSNCNHDLPKQAQPHDPLPTIYQTYELPIQMIDVTQYEGHSRTCPECQLVNVRSIPAKKRTGILGAKLSAMILHQSGVLGISKRDIETLLETVFHLPISLGTISKLEQEASKALKDEYNAIQKEVTDAAVKGLDESGWYERARKRWLWTCAVAKAVIFSIHPNRNLKALKYLMVQFKGIIITDRWKVYNHWPIKRRQLCWAHLNRNWDKLLEKIPQAKQLRDRWFCVKDKIFSWWHQHRDGKLTRRQLQIKVNAYAKYLYLILEDGLKHANKKVASFCGRLHALKEGLLTFIRLEGVEPTNNHTERVQRRAVMWRRTSFGCHSEKGCRFVERILSVVETLKLRGQSFMEFMTRTITNYRQTQLKPTR